MMECDPLDIESIRRALAALRPRCRGSFEWEVYPLVDSAIPQVEEPLGEGIGIVVRGGRFRLFDPLSGGWTQCGGSSLFFTIRGGNLLSVVPPEGDSGKERPLLTLQSRSEIPGFVALHVVGALETGGPSSAFDPIDGIFLPLPQFPDDEALSFEGYPQVSIQHLTGLLVEHFEAGCPWLMEIDPVAHGVAGSFMRAWFDGPVFDDLTLNPDDEVGGSLQGLIQMRDSIRQSMRELAVSLPEDAFVRDFDPDHSFRRGVPLFLSEYETLFPFTVRFHPEIFLPFVEQNLSPTLSEYIWKRILLGSITRDEDWPFAEPRAGLETATPSTVSLPSFEDQVGHAFAGRTLQFQLESDLGKVCDGGIHGSFREADDRIRAMRDLAIRMRGIIGDDEGGDCGSPGMS